MTEFIKDTLAVLCQSYMRLMLIAALLMLWGATDQFYQAKDPGWVILAFCLAVAVIFAMYAHFVIPTAHEVVKNRLRQRSVIKL